MANRTQTCHVTFRITNPAVAHLLTERAESSGRSLSLVARELTTEALSRPDQIAQSVAAVVRRLDDLSERLDQLDVLRERLERGIYLLLRHGGQLSAAQARVAMKKNFPRVEIRKVDSHVVYQKDGSRQ